MGTGLIHSKSSKQKLNVKSPTEAELVGTSDYMPYNVWVSFFLNHKDIKLLTTYFFKIIKVRLKWNKTENDHVLEILDTSISDIFL